MTIMKKLPIAGWIGGAIVCAVILMALVSWVWTPYDPLHAYPEVRLQSNSLQHWLGTDRFGRWGPESPWRSAWWRSWWRRPSACPWA